MAYEPHCHIAFDRGHKVIHSAAQQRIYLFQGYPGDERQWQESPTIDLISALSARFELVLMAVPTAKACFFKDNSGYRDKFHDYVTAVSASLPAKPSIVGGVSYGGYHAILAASQSPGRFIGWFAAMPVVQPGVLSELNGAHGALTAHEAKAISGLPGLITWGTADEVVNYRYAVEFAKSLHGVTTIAYPGHGHQTGSAQVADVANWLDNTIQ